MSNFYVNKAILLGNLTRDPELRYTKSGTAVATLNMATNHSVKNQNDEWEDVPTFHRIVLWKGLAEFIANNTQKGTKIYVEGRIHTREYEDKEGKKQRSREIIAEKAIPMSDKSFTSSSSEAQQDEEPTEQSDNQDVSPDDIPF